MRILSSVIAGQLTSFASGLNNFGSSLDIIITFIDESEDLSLRCLTPWKDFSEITYIQPFHSRQYCIFLAYLSRLLFLKGHFFESDLVSYLNKSINGCEIFGHVCLPGKWLIGHTVGIVIGRAMLGEDLVIHHNATIGMWNDAHPLIGSQVVLMNGSLIAGTSVIGDNVIVAPGVRIVDQIVPPNVIVYQGIGKEIVFKENNKNFISNSLV